MRLIALVFAILIAALPAHALEGFAKNVTLTDKGIKVPESELMYGDGSKGTLNDFKGEVLIVTLWQVNCGFCHKEMPVLNRLAGEMKGDGVRVVALGMDQNLGAIHAYMAKKNLTHLQPIMDVDKYNGTVFSLELYGRLSIATPTSFIVDKDGVIVASVWGLIDWDGDAARDYLRGLAAS